MRKFILPLFTVLAIGCAEQDNPGEQMEKEQALAWINFGSIKPQGWVAEQMNQDLKEGFVGHLDELVPELIVEDDIYGKDRLTKKVKSKDVGAVGDGEWDVQFLWWNSETQSNWWDGYIRHAILTQDTKALQEVKDYVNQKLSTQDADGYIGIYADDLRYKHQTENGELWAQASLFRGLLAYYEAFGDSKVLEAIEKAVGVTMEAYPIDQSTPFNVKKQFAGVGHGLTFTDVLDRLYQLTGKTEYRDYAVFLYQDFDSHQMMEEDIQTKNLLNPDYRFKGHGVHTYEHLRALTHAAYYSDDEKYQDALAAYLEKLSLTLTPSGGPIGDEWVFERTAHTDSIGYEYCSIHELLDSYSVLLQKSGDPKWADQMEWILFNAGQGARHPEESSIAYCKTDNSYHMLGAIDLDQVGEEAHNRFKYSPSHQDMAVCCVPNAGRIYPYFVKSMWMKSENGLVLQHFGASVLQTEVHGKGVKIIQESQYPFELSSQLSIQSEIAQEFEIAIRKPAWAERVEVSTDAHTREDEQYVYLSKKWSDNEHVQIQMHAQPQYHTDHQGKQYLSYGPMIYSLVLDGKEKVVKEFNIEGFKDLQFEKTKSPYNYQWISGSTFTLNKEENAKHWGQELSLQGKMFDLEEGEAVTVSLKPMGGTILRKISFDTKN